MTGFRLLVRAWTHQRTATAGRFWAEADMNPQGRPAKSVENDPLLPLAAQKLRIAPRPWDPISLVAISCSDKGSRKREMAVYRGRQCGDAISSKRLASAHAQGDGGYARIVEHGEVWRCRQTPFAALPSMRNLAPGVR